MQNKNTSFKQNEGEYLLFYGEFASISPDIQMKGGAIDSSLLLKAVKEHRDNTYLTVLDTHYISLSAELKKEVIEINPNTQFVQVHNLKEFTEYYDRGMDRELHPVQSVTNIESVMFYDTIKHEQPEVKAKVEKPKEYIKATTISSNEMMNDLQSQLNNVIDLKRDPQEFLDFMGLKGYDARQDSMMISVAKINLRDEFFRDYALPQAGKTAVESIEKVIPSMPAKSIKEGLQDGIEFVHDMVGDRDRGHLKIAYECTSLSDCHIKGVYRELENEKTVEQTKESNEEIMLENNTSKSSSEMEQFNKIEQQIREENITQEITEDIDNSKEMYDSNGIMENSNTTNYNETEPFIIDEQPYEQEITPKYQEVANEVYPPQEDYSSDYGMDIGD
jgi:hypothetical protein